MSLVLNDVRLSRKTMELSYTLGVPQGECLAIMGASGSGKTSLLHLIAGFEQPSSGEMLFDRKPITHLLPSERPLTILFQDNNLFEHLTIWDNIALGLRGTLHLSYKDRQFVEQVLACVGLENLGQKKPLEVSADKQQRAAIARCILQGHPLFLLDDPFSGLNPKERFRILTLVKDIHKNFGLTTLIVTHDPEEALFIAKKGIFVSNGKIISVGPIEDILSEPHPEIQKFQGASNYLKKRHDACEEESLFKISQG